MKYFALILVMILTSSPIVLFSTTLDEVEKTNQEDQNLSENKNLSEDKKVDENKKSIKKDDAKENNVEAREKDPDPNKLVKIGNLAFPVSQQPNPLVSFGQNIINEKQVQAYVLTTEFKNKREYFINVVPSILYGVTDDLSIFISVPVAARYRQEENHSAGVNDLIVQFEYSPYTKEYRTYYDQITLVGNVTIPTGSTKKVPQTGFGANSFFIGGIYSNMSINWFYFTSYGGLLTTTSHRTKFGNLFLYQFGVGRRIYSTSNWLFAGMVEFDGFYQWRNKIRGVTDPNSGGNFILLTPSIFISSKESLIVQFGMGFPIQQHLFGDQNRKEYLLALNVGWTF